MRVGKGEEGGREGRVEAAGRGVWDVIALIVIAGV